MPNKQIVKKTEKNSFWSFTRSFFVEIFQYFYTMDPLRFFHSSREVFSFFTRGNSVLEIDRNPKSRYNFYTEGVGGINSTGVTREVWDTIMNNADVIRGVFAGHMHEDYYAEMLAKTPSGEQKIIPQYVNYAAWADKGHVLKITVK